MKTLSIYHEGHFEISFSNTFDTFKILFFFAMVYLWKNSTVTKGDTKQFS